MIGCCSIFRPEVLCMPYQPADTPQQAVDVCDEEVVGEFQAPELPSGAEVSTNLIGISGSTGQTTPANNTDAPVLEFDYDESAPEHSCSGELEEQASQKPLPAPTPALEVQASQRPLPAPSPNTLGGQDMLEEPIMAISEQAFALGQVYEI